MNREIKFRIRLVCIKDGDGYKIGDKLTMFNEPFDRLNGVAFYPINSQVWEVVSYEQFTGLTDKNGKEIYEGDVLRTISTKTKVIETYRSGFHKGTPKKTRQENVENIVVCEWKGYGFTFTTLDPTKHLFNIPAFEIIGNIYENPELLNP